MKLKWLVVKILINYSLPTIFNMMYKTLNRRIPRSFHRSSFYGPPHGPWYHKQLWAPSDRSHGKEGRSAPIAQHPERKERTNRNKRQYTCSNNSKNTIDELTLTATSNLGEMTPHLLIRPISSTTIFPDLWSSMTSNSPMYPENKQPRENNHWSQIMWTGGISIQVAFTHRSSA